MWSFPACWGTVHPKKCPRKNCLQRASASPAIFNGLVEKQIFEVYYQEIGRLNRLVGKTVELNVLNEHQQRAYHEIMQSFQEKNVCLLHGVTSSGKTEVYIHLIEETIEARQAGALSVARNSIDYPDHRTAETGVRFPVWESITPSSPTPRRVEIWQKQLTERRVTILFWGYALRCSSRFRNLGLVIVDEEHENTYKQQDPAPRYHARNAAIVLAVDVWGKDVAGYCHSFDGDLAECH